MKWTDPKDFSWVENRTFFIYTLIYGSPDIEGKCTNLFFKLGTPQIQQDTDMMHYFNGRNIEFEDIDHNNVHIYEIMPHWW